MQNQAAFWDRAATKYAAQPISDMTAYDATLARARTYLHPTDRVLEFGAGTGTTALHLADSVAHYTASDISANMTQIGQDKAAEAGTTNIDFVAADIYNPVLDDSYDAVLAFNLLHLIEDTDAGLRRVYDLVKPGGVLISKTPCRPGRGTPLKWRLIMLALPILQWLGKAPFVNLTDAPEWDRAIERAGFKIIETGDYPASPRNHFVVAKKI